MTVMTEIAEVSNDASNQIAFEQPYAVSVEIHGTAPFLFHRWSVDGIEAKAKAAKGSKAKKEDDIESYVYRMDDGFLAAPGEYVRQSVINAAKFKQDPRSPRKSAMDLFKAGVVVLDEFMPFGVRDWDYIDRRRVMIQRNGITRHRPALRSGWKTQATFQILVPEYISPTLFNEVLQSAGRLVGIGDFRPTFGRFQVTKFEVMD
jgi:hypothetical protein